ncbi:MAG: LVIVD repeat-containing protein, partial [Pyrinomonadaceae bacterium]
AYITTEDSLVIISIDSPLNPRIVQTISLKHPHAIAIQFRYGFVVDEEGLKVVDLTTPSEARLVDDATIALADAHDVYVARTYAYVANGKEGIAIIDVEQPEKPRLDQTFNADGKLNDVHQVKVAMTNASLFAYVADGRNGLRILQLTSPETMPEYAGFSPRPRPVLIATFKTKGEALGVSKGLDRDRAADESGNQISVFGRRGARPFTFSELLRLLRTDDGKGDWFRVSDSPVLPPV